MHKYSLRWRIILPIGIIIILGIIAIVAVISINYTNTATSMAVDNIRAIGSSYANKIDAELEASFGCVKTYAAVLENAAGSQEADRDNYNEMMGTILQGNESLFGI